MQSTVFYERAIQLLDQLKANEIIALLQPVLTSAQISH
jgi:hypothetical protein